jgi:hypothetical protein
MWKVVLDHGHTTWLRTKLLIKRTLASQGKALDRFDKAWYKNNYFNMYILQEMKWNHICPTMRLFN